MSKKEINRWLLPEGIEEVLPPHAAMLEDTCRRIIDLFNSWGYQLVIPPMIEYLDSLLTGTGEDLELQTFKLTDLMSGRMMGVRADTTPQVARIDAHNLKREVPTRLCYMGTVLHTRPESAGGTRSPLQIGAELYGHAGIESDVEILCLLLQTLNIVGLEQVHIDLGHVGIYQGLVRHAGLDADQESELFDILQRKAKPELIEIMQAWSLTDEVVDVFIKLLDLNGGIEVLEQAHASLDRCGDNVNDCINDLMKLSELVKKRVPDAPLNFDLAELRGYHYHSGVMFAAYIPGRGEGIAFGGRYDDVGKSFGRARPATGFSTDIKSLINLSPQFAQQRQGIFAPWDEDMELQMKIVELRQQGEIVVSELPDQTGSAADMDCDRKLVNESGQWQVKPAK